MKYFLIFMTLFMGLFACDIDPERKKKDRMNLIEDLTILRTDSLQSEMDSICDLRKETEFDHLVDSMLEARLVEIKKRIKAYQK